MNSCVDADFIPRILIPDLTPTYTTPHTKPVLAGHTIAQEKAEKKTTARETRASSGPQT